MKKYLAKSKNGIRVYVDLDESHAATHIAEEPNLYRAAQSAIRKLTLKGDNMPIEVDMGYVVGKSSLVQTTDKDEIVYAKRKHRNNYTRFAKNREPVNSTNIVLILRRGASKRSYNLFSAWVGTLSPTFPGSDYETPESYTFWESHALVWGREPIDEDTVTPVKPW